MITWLMILGPAYLALLAFLAYRSKQKNATADEFMLAGKIGMMIGFLTVAASLFSTFTLMGMPDYFRRHGVGAWIALAVSDGAMIFLLIWFGFHIRKRARQKGFKGVAGLLSSCYQNPWAGYVYMAGIFMFLIPYVAIQIRGIAVFLNAAFPTFLPDWGWGLAIVVVMLAYSETGGLKAIIFADAMQGIILMIAVWVIAAVCVDYFGGVGEMFRQVEEKNVALLSTPGPEGRFEPQYLIAFFLSIILVPVTQPHITTRIVIMKDNKAMYRMAVAVGVFAMIVILPTIAIGMYGAVRYPHPEVSAPDYWAQVLLSDQTGFIAAISIIGLIAAAISTSDSQIFALGTELRSLLKGSEKSNLRIAKIAIVCFAFASLVFSYMSGNELVPLALNSFKGTAVMAPMILAGILVNGKLGKEIPVMTAVGMALFLLSAFKVIPATVAGLKLDWLLIVVLGLATALSVYLKREQA